jgi:transposase
MNDGSAATVMLGLPGFVLLAVSEQAGEVEQAVETAATESFCRSCGVAARLHDRRPTWVRDLPAGGRAVTLVWVKRVWRCTEDGCPRSTWTETGEAILPRASMTERARAEACRRVGEDGHSVARVAAAFGVSWATVMAAVRVHGRPRVDDPARTDGVGALGVDETAFLAGNAQHPTTYVTGIVDVRAPRLLDVVAGSSAQALSDWVCARPQDWREGIDVAALDPFRGYATALSTTLPAAVRVLDAFHVARLGFAAVDEVRRRVQPDTTGHRGRTGDPLYGIRRVARRGAENLSQTAWERLLAGLEAGDCDQQIGRTWIAAQDLRRIYTCRSRAQAEHRLYLWMVHCADAGVPELTRLARTIDAWREEFLAYFDTAGVSNGPTEAMNLLIKKIKRVSVNRPSGVGRAEAA